VIHGIPAIDLYDYASDMKYVKLTYLDQLQQSQGEFPWLQFKRAVAAKIRNRWILVVIAKLYSSPRACLQWLAFDERMLLTTNEKDTAAEIGDYVQFERDLAAREYAPPCAYEHSLADIIGGWLADFSLADHIPDPAFGPGSVSDLKGRASQLEKLLLLGCSKETIQMLTEYWYCDPEALVPACLAASNDDSLWRNRIIFRPKNALKHRIISAEPGWLSWLQQAIKRPLYRYVEGSPRMFTVFSDQSMSRDLALKGSRDGSFATIDFSNASDSITASLVARLFSGVPWLRDPLLATRSRAALLPDGQIIRLYKFAPMGSATCFATLDIIVLSMCELAIRNVLKRCGKPGDYLVYGDDAIIRGDCASEFIRISRAIGFYPNEDKSYIRTDTPSYYRESCGIEAFNGEDITPTRYSRFQEPLVTQAPVEPSWWASAIDLLNRFYLAGYHQARSAAWELIKFSSSRGNAAKQKLAQSIRDNVLRVDYSDYAKGLDGPLAIVVPDGTATNYHCRQGWDESYQRRYIRVRCLRTVLRDPHADYLMLNGQQTDSDLREQALYDLWFFKAEAERPSAADVSAAFAYKGLAKPEDYFRRIDLIETDICDDLPKLFSAAGAQNQKWDWVRYYP
jgi:hypothetical protein